MKIRGQPITGTAITLALVASMGGFIFGYDTGQISGFTVMPDFLQRFGECTDPGDSNTCKLPVWREGTIVGLLSIGTLVGALVGATLADLFGRRRAISMECVVFVLGVIIQVTAFHSWRQVAVGRWVAGLGVGALSAAVPLYQAETAPKAIRGTLTATYQLMITFGILLAALFNLGTNTMSNSGSWRITMALGIVFAGFLAVAILFMPESPRWLQAHGREQESQAAISKLHGIKNHADDVAALAQYHEIKKAVAIEMQQSKAGWFDCFRSGNKTRYRTFLGIVLQAGQQLTGANYFFYYGAQLFTGVGISNPLATQCILNGVNVVCTFLGLYVMERFGRRNPLIFGGLWQSAWLFIFASVGVTHDPTKDSEVAKVMICSACFFILGYASTWAPGIWILIGETFPTRTRAKQGAIATASNWLFNFLLAFFTSPITNDIGYYYGLVFAGCNLAGAVIVYFFLYESSSLSLEAVDLMYNDPAVKPWTSRKWVPPGYSSRYEEAHDTDEDTITNGGDIPSLNTKELNKERGASIQQGEVA